MKAIKTFTVLLALIVSVAANASTYSVTSSTSGTTTTFTITRTSSTTSETVRYRTVSLTAVEGQHFNAVSGDITFAAGESSKTVEVTERTPKDRAYKFQNGATRTYRFEVMNLLGFLLAYLDRSINTGISVPTSGVFDEKSLTVNSGTITVTDGGYAQAYHAVPMDTYFSNAASQDYFVHIGAELRMVVTFDASEKDDGYQYIQIIPNNTSNPDTNAGEGDPGTLSRSIYMAGFAHNDGAVSTSYLTYEFPVMQYGSACGKQTYAWDNSRCNNNRTGTLYQQYFKDGSRASDGKLIIPTNLQTLGIHLNASGSGSDTWYARGITAKIRAVDSTAPAILSLIVNPGCHAIGNTIYLTVAFSEIVTISGSTKRISTNWGYLNYLSGSGTNVLTFRGSIQGESSGSLEIKEMINNDDFMIADLAGNTLEGTLSGKNLCTLDNAYAYPYAYSLSDFTQSGGEYLISSAEDLLKLSGYVNSGNDCEGLTFRQTQDIVFVHTTAWNDAGSIENNFMPIGMTFGGNSYRFKGTYDGGGYSISGLRVYYRDGYYTGLFGDVEDGIVKRVNIENSRITGYPNVGGICGYLYGGDIEDCQAAADVAIHCDRDATQSLGGIVGTNNGEIRRCISSAKLSSSFLLYEGGAIAGGKYENSGHDISDCIAINAVIPSATSHGAILGLNAANSRKYRNYYRSCTVAGVANATGVGAGGADISANNGAMPIYSLTLCEGVTNVRTVSATLPGTGNATYTDGADIGGTPYYVAASTVVLSAATPAGYERTILINGTPATNNGDGTFSAAMPAADATVTTSTTPVSTFHLTAAAATIMGEAKYITTFYSGTLNIQLPEGTRAYTASGEGSYNDGEMVMVFHLVGDDGRIIPSDTAVIIVSDTQDITLSVLAYTNVTAYPGNILKGSDVEFRRGTGKFVTYVLNIVNGVPGFYRYTGTNVMAGKAYYVNND